MKENTLLKYALCVALLEKIYLKGLVTIEEKTAIEAELKENFERIDRIRVLPSHQKR